MPVILPITELKKTSEISETCKKAGEPVFITKNGYGDMVIMSMETYERTIARQNIFSALAEAEQDVADGKIVDAHKVVRQVREDFGL